MANISYWQGSWVDAGETGLVPGGEMYWVMWGFGYGDAIGVTVEPTGGSPAPTTTPIVVLTLPVLSA